MPSFMQSRWGMRMLAEKFPALAHHWRVLVESWRFQNVADGQVRPRSDHEFLPAALEIMEKPPSPGLRYLMLGLCGLFATALLWSFIGKVDVVATAGGKVVPSGNVKLIQPVELGYVRAIHVRNGQHVKAGDLLLELDATLAGADAAQASSGLMSAELLAARNAAILDHLEGRAASFVAPPGTPPEVARAQQAFVRTAIGEYEAQRASLIQQRAEQHAVLAGANAELDKLQMTLPLIDKQMEARKALSDKGYYSRLKLLEYEQLRLEHGQNIEVQRASAAKARAAIATLDAQLAQLRSGFGKTAAAELTQAQDRSSLARGEVTKSARRRDFQLLRAPVSGTVQQLAVSTIGGVVQPAQTVMVIVPDGVAPIVEAQVLNKDIGFVREGQPVRVKLEAYPFTDYGIVPGVVESISRDAIENQSIQIRTEETEQGKAPRAQPQGLFYLARIRLLQKTINVAGRAQPIGPGLQVQAEIKTGERRIINYLLSPLARTVDEAGRER